MSLQILGCSPSLVSGYANEDIPRRSPAHAVATPARSRRKPIVKRSWRDRSIAASLPPSLPLHLSLRGERSSRTTLGLAGTSPRPLQENFIRWETANCSAISRVSRVSDSRSLPTESFYDGVATRLAEDVSYTCTDKNKIRKKRKEKKKRKKKRRERKRREQPQRYRHTRLLVRIICRHLCKFL